MKTLIIIVLVLVAGLAGFLIYSGALHSVKIEEREIGPYTLLYKDQRGPYQQTGKSIQEICTALKAYNITPDRGFGIFYDDPKTVKREDLRSEAGIILNLNDAPKIEPLKAHYKLREYPRQRSMVAEFPFRNRLSILIGVFRVYPAMVKYANEKGYPMNASLEIYDLGKTITYTIPIGGHHPF